MHSQANQAVQPSAVAGLFYPAEPGKLRDDVDRFLLAAETDMARNTPANSRPIALIAPHAGYVYSGAVAAAAYARLIPYADEIRKVVIFAPAHRLAISGLATASADEFSTPLGRVPVDLIGRDRLLAGDFALSTVDEAFREEHALEVQLPFLQRLLVDFEVLPILVGDADPVVVEKVIECFWGQADTLIVVSSDLSHFHDYETAEQLDKQTTENIEAMQAENIGFGGACGRIPINGLLLAARKRGLMVRTVARCNSGDTAGDRQRVVGYGAYVFS